MSCAPWMDRKTLVLSPNVDLHGGNMVTLARIRDYLTSHGQVCELSSPKAFPDQRAFLHKVKAENIQMLIGIHAYKTGIFMKDSGLPYVLIIGGTDVNVFAKEPNKLKEMRDVVTKARYVVCFSRELKVKVKQLWPEFDHRRLKVVRQGIEIHLPRDEMGDAVIKKHLQEVYHEDELPVPFQQNDYKPIVFTLVGGVRPVKNPLYLVNVFQDWHARDERIWLVVVGHVLDQSYSDKQFLPAITRRPGVLFIPGVSLSEVHSIMIQSFALVNSSDNEGMCLAILEAMKLGLPVLARDNLGNRSVVEDKNTGLVFTSPQTFITKAEWLIDHPKERAKIVSNAKEFVMSYHCMDVESEAYVDMVKQCLSDRIVDDAVLMTTTVSVVDIKEKEEDFYSRSLDPPAAKRMLLGSVVL